MIADAHTALLLELAHREHRLCETSVFAQTWLPLLEAGADGATVLRWELTEWAVDDAKLCAHVELDPWADYVMRCERGAAERAAGPGIGCVLRGELTVDGELVQPFGAWQEPADVTGSGSLVRVVLVRAEEPRVEALAQGSIHL